jgi:PAS domain-containing protein/HPt (histidine-containing phosphotransfer) domain-containing protein
LARIGGRFVSIGTKLVVLIAALLSLVGLVLYVELVEREWESLVDAKRTAAAMVADLFSASLVAPLDFGDTATVEKNLEHLKQNGDVVYAVVRAEGVLAPLTELHPEAALPIAGDGALTRAEGDRVVARRVVADPTGRRLGTVVVHFSLAPERAAYDRAKRRILVLSLLLTAGVAAALIALTRRLVVGPVERLAVAAHEMEEGRAARVEVAANDELGRLGGAFNAMAAAIVDRETRLRELFDHMRQAILVFRPDGVVERSASRRAAEIFGIDALEGRSIREVLYPSLGDHAVEVRAFEEWRDLVFASPAASFDELAELGPAELTVEREGRRIVLLLEFRPIVRPDEPSGRASDGEVARVMLLATDVTEARSLKLAAEASRREHARQMASMRLLLAGGTHQFAGFAEDAGRRLSRCLELVDTEPVEPPALAEIFRAVHTLRGEARTFDLTSFESEATRAEERLAAIAGRTPNAAERAALREALDAALQAIRAATEEFVASSPIGRTVLDQVTVRRSDVDAMEQLARERTDPLAQAARKLAARPFGEIALRQVTTLPELAEKAGKLVHVEVLGKEVLVPPDVARVLGGVLAVLCRNAVAHGIESPSAREERGKPRSGRILLSCHEGPRGPRIVVEDDGGGVDRERLAARAAALGLDTAPGNEASLVFAPGLSTVESNTELAGRGMGLPAVVEGLARVGWTIGVTSAPESGTGFTLEPR